MPPSNPKQAAGKAADSALSKAADRGPRLGEVLADNYRLVRELGRGAMGAVYAARDYQLENEVARVVALHHGGWLVTEREISEKIRKYSASGFTIPRAAGAPLKSSLMEAERGIIARAIEQYGGNISRTALALGVSRYGLYKKMAVHGIRRPPAGAMRRDAVAAPAGAPAHPTHGTREDSARTPAGRRGRIPGVLRRDPPFRRSLDGG